MDGLETILTRRSVRKFTDQPIDEKQLKELLLAGMSAPSCANTRDWSFLVVKDKETLNKMADANGRPAQPLRQADVGILVLGDLDRAFKHAKDYWIIDGAIAAENILLAAHAMGLGGVWLGTWPQMERVNALRELFQLPDNVVPHSILALGTPAEQPASKECWEEDRIHYEKW